MIYLVIGIFVIFIVFCIVLIIYNTKFDMVYSKLKDDSSALDSLLTDMYHKVRKIVELIKTEDPENADSYLDEALTKTLPIGLGMRPSEQKHIYSELLKAEKALDKLVNENKRVSEIKDSNEEFSKLVKDIKTTKAEIVASAVTYEKSTEEFNKRVGAFPTSVIASIKKLYPRAYFEAAED